MKILFVLNQSEIGGAEKFIFELFSHFHANKYEVSLFFLKRGSFEFCKVDSILQSRIIFGNRLILFNPASIYRLILLSRKYDIIHVNLFPSLYFAFFVKLFSNAKLVYTEHSTNNKRRGIPFIRKFDRLIYKIYDSVICINSEVKNSLVLHLENDKSLKIIENGVNLDFIKNETKIQINSVVPSIIESDFVMCQVSSFIEPKDQMTIVQAMRMLPDYIKLILVGDGINRVFVENYVMVNKLEKRVFFLGIRKDIIPIIKSSNLCILSSGYEGLSIFCLESFASGVPIIGSDVPGLRELLEPRALFKFKSPISFSELVLKILNNPSFYSELKVYGLVKSNDYSMDSCFKKHVELYKNIFP